MNFGHLFFIVNVLRTFHFGGLLFFLYLRLLFSPEALLKYDIHAFLAPGQQKLLKRSDQQGRKKMVKRIMKNCIFCK